MQIGYSWHRFERRRYAPSAALPVDEKSIVARRPT